MWWLVLALAGAIALSRTGIAQSALPRLISKGLLDDYLRDYLVLSPEQAKHVEELHVEYSSAWATSFNAEIEEFNKLWSSAYVELRKFEGERMDVAFETACAAAEKLRSRLRSANDLFFDSIEATLADEQLNGMQRVRSAHDRLSYRVGADDIREQNVDVISLVESLALEPVEAERVQAVILDFEPAFVSLLRHVAEVRQRASLFEFRGLELVRQNMLHGESPLRLAECDQLGLEYTRLKWTSAKRLIAMNRRGLAHLKQVLCEQSARDLQRIYDEHAYPEVFPDPMNASDFYDKAREALPDLEEEHAAVLDVLREEFERQHAALSRQMSQAIFELAVLPYEHARKEHESALFEELWQKQAEIGERVRQLGMQRERLNETQIEKIRSALDVEQIAKLPPWSWEARKPLRNWAKIAGNASPEEREAEKQHRLEQRRRERGESPMSQPAEAER